MNLDLLGFIGPWQILIILFMLAIIGFWIYALVDILKHNFTGDNKIIWLLVVLLLGLLGTILYFTIGRKSRILG